METTSFGRNLKNIRESNGLTQLQLADRLGVTQTTISAWETRRKMPKSNQFVLDICKLFNCTEQDLFGYSDGFYAKQANGNVSPFTSDTSAPVLGCAPPVILAKLLNSAAKRTGALQTFLKSTLTASSLL